MRINTHYKITLTFTIITAVILSVGYLYLNQNLRSYTYQNIQTDLKKKTTLAKHSLENMKNDQETPEVFDQITDRIGQDLNLRVTIISLTGKVLGDSELDGGALQQVENHLNRPEVQDALKSGFGESKRFSSTINTNMLYMAMPFSSQRRGGVIRLSLPLSDIDLISKQLKRIIAFSLFAVFIMAIIITFFASAYISKPIREISKIAKRIAQGDFSKIDTFFLNDEIGDLGHAFNEMSEQLESRLQEMNISRSRLEAVLLSMLEGVLVVDPKGKILLMNRALKDIFQIKHDVTGKNSIEVIRNLEIAETIDCAIKSQSHLDACEISLAAPEDRVLSVYATPVLRDNQREGAILVFHDNTNLRRLEKIRQDFVANVSHELRTPISSIQGYAETLLDGALDDQAHARDFIKIVHTEAERLARLVDDLLNLSKIESGKLNMDLNPCPLFPIIKRVVASLDMQAVKKSITIRTKVSEKLHQVIADETRLAQVLFNLIENALKYTPPSGCVVVSAEEGDAHIKVSVADTGIGIPDKDLPRIFERFYRVDKARSRELGGTGLGLSIVKHIVQAHNGEISVSSQSGKGTTFTFTIPSYR